MRISLASDAHMCFQVGAFDNAIKLLETIDFPQELIVSRSLQSFEAYLVERKQRIANR